MASFVCHVCGQGFSNGNHCDYYISCNETLMFLPKNITTMREAESYVRKEILPNYELESATIYEVGITSRVDVKNWQEECNREREKLEAEEEEKEAREQYEKLKKRFATGA